MNSEEIGHKLPRQGMGFIYILSNYSYRDDLFKIGYTTQSVKKRVQNLSAATGVPTKFIIEKVFEIEERFLKEVENKSHKKLKNNGFHFKKEFFKTTLVNCTISVEDSILEVTKISAIELVGLALHRAKLKEEEIQRKNEFLRLKAQKEREQAIEAENRRLIEIRNQQKLAEEKRIQEEREAKFQEKLAEKKKIQMERETKLKEDYLFKINEIIEINRNIYMEKNFQFEKILIEILPVIFFLIGFLILILNNKKLISFFLIIFLIMIFSFVKSSLVNMLTNKIKIIFPYRDINHVKIEPRDINNINFKEWYYLGDKVLNKLTNENLSFSSVGFENKIRLFENNMFEPKYIIEKQAVENIVFTKNRAIVSCPKCGQNCGVPIINQMEVKCPLCLTSWIQKLKTN